MQPLGDLSFGIQEPKGQIAGNSLPEQLDDGRFGNLHLSREDQGLARVCARVEESAQALSKQALRFGVRQEFELCRSHTRFLSVKRTPEESARTAALPSPFGVTRGVFRAPLEQPARKAGGSSSAGTNVPSVPEKPPT